jgi:hypothetical protein
MILQQNEKNAEPLSLQTLIHEFDMLIPEEADRFMNNAD